MTVLNVKHLRYNLTLLIHITHWTKKIHKNSQSRELKWPKVSKKRREEFTGIEEGLTKIITIQLNQERKG